MSTTTTDRPLPPPPPSARPVPPPPATPPAPPANRPSSGGGRTPWVVLGSLLVVAAVGWGTFNFVDLVAHEEHTERFTVPAAELTGISIDNDNGSITIVGTGGDEVVVEAKVSDGLRATGFELATVGDVLEISGDCPAIGAMWCRVGLEIEVPRRFDVAVDADNDPVDVRGIEGDVAVDADNGSIELAAVSGSIMADGDNGGIRGVDLSSPVVQIETNNGNVELLFVAAPDEVRASSNNGDVDVAVPRVEGGYDVTAATDNGEIDIAVNDNPDSVRTIEVESNNGDVTVRSAD